MIFSEIKKFLDSNNISYKTIEHEAVFTSEQAAEVRKTPIEMGAKAIILRSEGKFLMAVMSAAKNIDSKKLKKLLNTKSLSFATPEEVFEVTKCKPGSVPPFGNLFNLKVYVDKSLLDTELIDFNAGSHTNSIEMKSEDYIKLINPIIGEFTCTNN